ncbi:MULTISPECIES: ferredoxin [unclassified Roseovarius]|uniref:ferredoxin n=1 Tax=unclassified Roseovarius TaxID=2614913 RepID=UPI00273D827A|nr:MULTISPECIES: ferredoxin [unclassified Roseovarius]
MTLDDIASAAQKQALSVFGAFHPAQETAPEEIQTLVLLGPQEPGFWPYFSASPEAKDGKPDPLDRWSKRVIDGLAHDLSLRAFYPFGGPPYQPFIGWATASGRAHVSPVGLLVHDVAGLMVSYRGALGLQERVALPPPPPNPCLSCKPQPCRTACPVAALQPDGYDVAACKADLENPANDCMAKGCAARRACPVSQSYGRVEAQSAFHMEAFK